MIHNKDTPYSQPIRLIARLDIKSQKLIKGVHFEGLRVLGPPNDFAKEYYHSGIDEVIYMDTVATLYGRNTITEVIESTANEIFVPMTVGGGVRSVDDVGKLLKSGADKVALNTAAIKNPELLSQIANKYGSQCVVLSIEAKKIGSNKWEAYTDNGREHTGLDVLEWVKTATKYQIGEILLTSIDQEGTKKGLDLDLIKTVTKATNVPVIASGGIGSLDDIYQGISVGGAQAIAMASVLHYKKFSISDARTYCLEKGLNVRTFRK